MFYTSFNFYKPNLKAQSYLLHRSAVNAVLDAPLSKKLASGILFVGQKHKVFQLFFLSMYFCSLVLNSFFWIPIISAYAVWRSSGQDYVAGLAQFHISR